MNKNKIVNILLYVLLGIELIIFISFAILDLKGIFLPYLKYSLIIMNFLIGLIILILSFNKEKLFLVLGLLITIFSDYFLLINPNQNYFALGVFIFIFVQIMYFIRNIYLSNLNKKEIIISISFRIGIFLLALLFIYFVLNPYFILINLLAVFYFINLMINLIETIIFYKRNKKKNLILIIGLTLFIFCDISVGLNYLIINPIINYLIWIFYAPSQFIILYSIKD